MSRQHVRFCKSFDGAEIAYSVSGRGPVVVLMPSWLTHLEYQKYSVAWQPWLDALSSRYTLVRYDPRGCGLSDRNTENLSFETWVRDFDSLVRTLDLDSFSLVGTCQGGAVAIAYAGRESERIDRLVLYGTYARGRNRRGDIALEPEKAKLMLEMLKLGWATRITPSCGHSPPSFSPKAISSTCAHGASCSERRPRRPTPSNSLA